jgi:hypothetical protein
MGTTEEGPLMYGMTADVAVADTVTGHESGPACTTYRLIGGEAGGLACQVTFSP